MNRQFKQIFNFGLVFVVFIFFDRILQMLSNITGQNLEQGEQQQDESNFSASNEELESQKLTYPNSEYFDIADTIYTALQASFTEDEEAIYSSFRLLKNDADYLKLKVVYGKRPIGLYGFRNDLNLSQSIRSLLNDDEVNKINRILANAKIKYRI